MDFRHRKEIDGLRAVAVVPVMMYHAGMLGFGGGYVGVDVFFVISGYLITSLISSEMDVGKFSLRNFYERRIRRIFPALLFVTVCCLPPAMYWMFPNQLKTFANSMVSVFYLGSNFWLSKKTGYFDVGVDEYPLVHTWSLSIEEQFYLLFPMAFMLAWRLGRRNLVIAISILAILSFGLAEWGWRHYPSSNFYLLPGRAWELLIGSLAAFYLQHYGQTDGARSEALATIGLILIFVSILVFDAETPFPSAYTLVPALGTVLVILYASKGTHVNWLLSTPFMVGIGLVSYSAYLWHQPLFAFLRIQSLNVPASGTYVLLGMLSFVLAWFTWKFIEQPIRKKENFRQRTLYLSFFGLTGSMIVLGLILKSESEILSIPNSSVEAKYFASFSVGNNANYADCDSTDAKPISPSEACIFGNKKNVRAAIWGDSHANALAGEVGKKFQALGIGLRVFISSGCLPISGLRKSNDWGIDGCAAYTSEVFEYLKSHPEITTVIVAS
jgi:peptidoglycan/LPS O-acetylase OafA/YrhL